jgi:3-oxoacyl-[acyl-carrier-protein] synthase-3
MERNGVKPEQVDLFVAHQANLRIIDAARERLGFPDDKVVKNIQDYGNTTAATIPLLWDECVRDGRLRPGALVLMLAFGAGMGWGALLLRA